MKDRLIDLIQKSVNGCARHWAEVIADYLLKNGVIVPQLQAGNTVWVIDNFRTFTKPIIESRTVLSVQYYKSDAI